MMDDMHGTMVSQRAEIATLRQQVETLAPYQGKAEELQKKCDKLEDTIKTMKTDMGGLRRQVAEFQGKVAINHDELMQSIKDAIKDDLKNITVGVRLLPAWPVKPPPKNPPRKKATCRTISVSAPAAPTPTASASSPKSRHRLSRRVRSGGRAFFVVVQCGAKGAVPYGSPCPG